jgi:hypothetical protein
MGLLESCFAFVKAFERSLLFQKYSVKDADSLNAFLIYRYFIRIIAHDVTEKKSSNSSTN